MEKEIINQGEDLTQYFFDVDINMDFVDLSLSNLDDRIENKFKIFIDLAHQILSLLNR